MEHLAQVIWKTAPLGPTRQLHHKAVITSLGVIGNLPDNTEKHERADKMERPRKIHQMKEQEKCPEKELNEVEATKIPDTEFKTMVIRMLRILGEMLIKVMLRYNIPTK